MSGQELIIVGYMGPQEILMIILTFGVPMAIVIVLLRWLGAWMFRINDVMKYQKEIIDLLVSINKKQEDVLKTITKETKE